MHHSRSNHTRRQNRSGCSHTILALLTTSVSGKRATAEFGWLLDEARAGFLRQAVAARQPEKIDPSLKLTPAHPKLAEELAATAVNDWPTLIRVRLEALSRIAELSQHEADGRKFQKREGVAVEIFPILGETTATVEPGDRAFDDPALGQSHESLDVIGSSDDFGFEMRQGFGERVRKNRALIGAVGKQLLKEWKLTEQRGQQQNAAVAILDAGGMHDGVQQ
jgi:hypothetical protein